MNAAIQSDQAKGKSVFRVEPVLQQLLTEAREEHRRLQEMFRLMGWQDLPDRLKMEIKDDVSAIVEELEGQYSTCDPFVLKRRARVDYWVNCFQDGVCSLETALEALSVNRL